MRILLVTFLTLLMLPPIMEAALADSEFPFSAANDPYLMTPMSYEATNNIKKMKQEIGDLPSRSENDSFIKNVKQQVSINKDGTADINEDIEFSVTKQKGDDEVLFTRRYPLSRIDKVTGRRTDIKYEVIGIWGTDIEMTSDKTDKYMVITAKSSSSPFKSKKVLTGTAHISLQVLNSIAEVSFDDEYSTLIYSDDYSLPVDDIFITVEIPENITMKAVKSEISGDEGTTENMARIVNNKAGFKTIDGLKDGQLFIINAWFSKGIGKTLTANGNKEAK